MDTKRKVAIVTGGASGIGQGIVEAALVGGWSIGILDLPNEALTAAADRLRDHPVHCCGVDIRDEVAVAAALNEVEEVLGDIAGVVNCAGIGQNIGIFDTTAEQFRQILDVNVVGTFIVSQAAARRMRHRGGAIVNITSASGIQGSEGRVAYGSSKGAANAMTRIMAVELAPMNIRVNAVAPGPVETPMTLKWHDQATRHAWTSSVPMKRYGSIAEIAGATLFLLDGDKAGYVTGQTLAVDGGFTIAGLMGTSEASAIAR